MKKFKKFLSMLLAATMVCGMSARPAMADGLVAHDSQGTYGSATSSTEITAVPFTKILTAVEDAILPTETFTFTMTPVTVDEGATVADSDTKLYTGADLSDAEDGSLTETIAINDATYTNDNLVSVSKTAYPSIYEDSDTTGYIIEKSFSLANATFSKPGAYRYIIDEAAMDDDSLIVGDTRTYTVDLYANNEGQITYMIAKDISGNKSDIVFENRSQYTDIVIKKVLVDEYKQVAPDTEFTFKIKIPTGGVALDLEADTVMNAYIRDKNGTETKIKDDDKLIKVGGEQTNSLTDAGWMDFSLKNGESLVLKGVPVGMIFNLQETSTDGYTVQYGKVDGSTDISSYATYSYTGWVTTAVNGTYVEFKNTKTAITDSGIVQNVMPYVVVVLIAAAGCVVLLISKKRRNAR
jgi:hypothetical protein